LRLDEKIYPGVQDMRLIFARHGESQANVERIISNRDLPHALTETGKIQARALADMLAQRTVNAIYASPILRAQETAQLIGRRLDCTVTTSDALREFDCGIAEGRGDSDAWQMHKNVVTAWNHDQDYDRRIEGGESFNDMVARFKPFVNSLVDEFGASGGNILCVTHGALLMQMLPYLTVNLDRAFVDAHGLGNCVPVLVVDRRGRLVCTHWGQEALIEQL
jgi:probable phosphoglycerate mutase